MLLTLHYSSHMHTYILYSTSSTASLCNTCITSHFNYATLFTLSTYSSHMYILYSIPSTVCCSVPSRIHISLCTYSLIVQSRAIFQVSQPAIVVLLTQRNVINPASQPASPRIAALQKLLHSTERLDQCSVNNAATASQPTKSTTQPLPASLLQQYCIILIILVNKILAT